MATTDDCLVCGHPRAGHIVVVAGIGPTCADCGRCDAGDVQDLEAYQQMMAPETARERAERRVYEAISELGLVTDYTLNLMDEMINSVVPDQAEDYDDEEEDIPDVS